MDGNDTINITVIIAGRPYPLKIKVEDEIIISQIVKEINDKVRNFQLTYSKKDKQDCLAMAVMTYALDLFKSKNTDTIDQQQLISQAQKIDDVLKVVLAS